MSKVYTPNNPSAKFQRRLSTREYRFWKTIELVPLMALASGETLQRIATITNLRTEFLGMNNYENCRADVRCWGFSGRPSGIPIITHTPLWGQEACTVISSPL